MGSADHHLKRLFGNTTTRVSSQFGSKLLHVC